MIARKKPTSCADVVREGKLDEDGLGKAIAETDKEIDLGALDNLLKSKNAGPIAQNIQKRGQSVNHFRQSYG